jgi:branched-chain amino acid transport system substrate-binding protein
MLLRGRWKAAFALAVVPLLIAAFGLSAPAGASGGTAPGVTSKTITLGVITSLTGDAASEYAHIIPAVEARIDLQNAKGGVDGRKIKLITEDDHSSPATNATASSALIAKGVFGVIDESPFVFGGYKVLEATGVPVTGGGYDGTEWEVPSASNMFTYGYIDPHYPANTASAAIFKELGVTKVAAFGYGTSPSSTDSAKAAAVAFKKEGLTSCYLNTSIPFGTVAVAPIALSMKNAGCTGAYMAMDANTNFAILTAAKQAGVDMKAAVSATGYGQTLLDTSAAAASGQDTYFLAAGVPVELKTKGTKAFQAALSKYAHFTGIPGFTWYEGWSGAALMIKGLELAGKNPTRTAFSKNLRKVTKFTATGVLYPVTMNYFKKPPTTTCSYYTELKGTTFVPVPASGKPTCGTNIPGTTLAP